MAKFRKRPVVIEAITFNEFVEYGLAHSENTVDGIPWSFYYKGQPVTHENDDCYLISTTQFKRGDMLVTDETGEIYPCRSDIFEATYEPAN